MEGTGADSDGSGQRLVAQAMAGAAAENGKARQTEPVQEGESQSPQKDGEEEDLGDTTRIDFGELQFGRDYEIK